jgi:DNA-binding response OmpR family regulator/anti-sigma regulatory factor (Ser/Thr protein kinase)
MGRPKIILIEDERPLLENLKDILEIEKFEVSMANNANEALTILRTVQPDLVVCDIMMPDMDGYTFYQRFRALGFKEVPFIFLSAKSDLTDIRNGMNLGADDYLTKPVAAKDLIQAINIRLDRKYEATKSLNETISRFKKGFELATEHEFRTPMSGIVGFLESLKGSINKMDVESANRYVSLIEQSSERLFKMFNKLRIWNEINDSDLLVSQDSNTYNIKENIHILLQKIAAKYYRQSDVAIVAIEDAWFNIDPYYLNILVEELLDNAFKFSKRGDHVILGTAIENSKYIIKISDSGNNSTAEQIRNIQPFKQIDRNKFEQQGLGMGLTIVNTIVELLKGEFLIEDNSPCGIIFTIKLPIINNK